MNNDKIILEMCIADYKKRNQLQAPDSVIFDLFSLSLIAKSYSFTFEDIHNSIVDGGSDGGIDSIIIVVDDTIINIEDVLEVTSSGKK